MSSVSKSTELSAWILRRAFFSATKGNLYPNFPNVKNRVESNKNPRDNAPLEDLLDQRHGFRVMDLSVCPHFIVEHHVDNVGVNCRDTRNTQ